MKAGKAERKETKIIHSLDKGLYLLEVIEHENSPITLNELWRKIGWDKATILRLCNTLERRGYLHKDQVTKSYTLGIKIYGLHDSIVKNLDIQAITRPYLNELVAKTGESAHLALVLEKSVVFIDKVVSDKRLAVNIKVGGREPLHCTSLGKAYLAFIDQDDIENFIDVPLPRLTSRTIVSLKMLKEALKEVRKKGFAVDNEEYIEGIRCIGVPILNQFSLPVAMIGISGPKFRLTLKAAEEYGRYMTGLALKISKWFGYSK